MKRVYFVAFVVLFAATAWSESYRTTTDDLYMRSYDLVLGSKASSMIASQRSDEYKSQYEICDQNHNCVPLTASLKQEKERPARKSYPAKEEVKTMMKVFLHAPIWQ